MKCFLKLLYMFLFHPYLFWKYSIRRSSKGFFVNGYIQNIKTDNLILGNNIRFGSNTRINFYSNNGKKKRKLIIGNNCYFGNRNSFLVGEKIIIGENVLIASDVCITSENHQTNPLDKKEYMHQPLVTKSVKIGSGSWVGEKVVILPGVTIGEKCVIGAGSIVSKNIPSYSIAVGNPAKIIKKFDFNLKEWRSV